MKQGTGNNTNSGRKVEPISKGISMDHVANIGVQVVRTRAAPPCCTEGYKAPMMSSSNHKSGSQGKH